MSGLRLRLNRRNLLARQRTAVVHITLRPSAFATAACRDRLVVREAARARAGSARHAFRFIVRVFLTGSPSRVPVRKTQTMNQEYRQSLHEDLQAVAQAQHQVQGRLKAERRPEPKWRRTNHMTKRSEKVFEQKNIYI